MTVTVVTGVLIGALIILGIRFFSYKPVSVHYHANFAVYINGQREEFKNPIYYTEVEESCSSDQEMTPHERAHMHDNINDIVHVEDHAVTWGQFFQNLGWNISVKLIETQQQVYLTDTQNKVTFILNGEATENILNRVIEDQDKLLVDYGSGSQNTLQEEYDAIPSTAHKYDVEQDPASCMGNKKITVHDRLTHLF